MQLQTLSAMSTNQLVALHNEHAEKPIKGWGKKREELISRVIGILPAPKSVRDDVSPRTIREAALELLTQVDFYENKDEDSSLENRVSKTHAHARSVGLSYVAILASLKEEFPEGNTSIACLRWYSVKLCHEMTEREAGYEGYIKIQRRPRPSKKAAVVAVETTED